MLCAGEATDLDRDEVEDSALTSYVDLRTSKLAKSSTVAPVHSIPEESGDEDPGKKHASLARIVGCPAYQSLLGLNQAIIRLYGHNQVNLPRAHR